MYQNQQRRSEQTMEYWIQLDIEGSDDTIVIEEDQQVDNWLQQDSPMLAAIPDNQLRPQQLAANSYRVSQLKFGQNDEGYYLDDHDEKINLKSGDRIIFANTVYVITITKMSQSRRSLVPVDFLASEAEQFHQEHANQQGAPVLNTHFDAPNYYQNDVSQQDATPSYQDMQNTNHKITGKSPLDGIDDLYSDQFERPFQTHVPLHHQQSLAIAKPELGSVQKLKKLLWGDD